MINTDLLRDTLGFEGVLISDALDMKALNQDIGQVVDVIAAVRSGVDLLLMTADPEQQNRVTRGLALATSRGLISQSRLEEADDRVTELRRWISTHESPPMSEVGSEEHEALCLEASARSITLVKDDVSVLPLRPDASVLVIETEPTILTPADTSDYERPYLAEEISKITSGTAVAAVVPFAPTPTDITTMVKQARGFDVVVVATVAAHLEPAQGDLVTALASAHGAVVAVSQRTPWDLEAYPSVATYVCAWSANRIPARATASALFGGSSITGRLPAAVGQFPIGHGLDR
jgi:beta-N-acetylhexosaminidase